ncbi:MAG: hypothetical protein IJ415_01075 [Clostridia bacterium]|nr:hypothetical protein [Clostridia bacterium]
MKTVKFSSVVRRSDWLTKPVWFSQSTEYIEKNNIQFNNRKIGVEYKYEISIELNRDITDKEYLQMQNAINSIIVCHGDFAKDGLFIWSRMLHLETIVDFMQGGDISIDYMAKRYVLANGKDIGFVSDYEVLVDKKEQIATL